MKRGGLARGCNIDLARLRRAAAHRARVGYLPLCDADAQPAAHALAAESVRAAAAALKRVRLDTRQILVADLAEETVGVGVGWLLLLSKERAARAGEGREPLHLEDGLLCEQWNLRWRWWRGGGRWWRVVGVCLVWSSGR